MYRHVYLGDHILFRIDKGSATAHFDGYDLSNNVRLIRSYATSVIVELKQRYSPFGVAAVPLTSSSGESPRYRYAQQQSVQGASGWYYMGARWYDPSIGRFLSRDPVLADDYAYSYGNPVSFWDPSGLDAFEDLNRGGPGIDRPTGQTSLERFGVEFNAPPEVAETSLGPSAAEPTPAAPEVSYGTQTALETFSGETDGQVGTEPTGAFYPGEKAVRATSGAHAPRKRKAIFAGSDATQARVDAWIGSQRRSRCYIAMGTTYHGPLS